MVFWMIRVAVSILDACVSNRFDKENKLTTLQIQYQVNGEGDYSSFSDGNFSMKRGLAGF